MSTFLDLLFSIATGTFRLRAKCTPIVRPHTPTQQTMSHAHLLNLTQKIQLQEILSTSCIQQQKHRQSFSIHLFHTSCLHSCNNFIHTTIPTHIYVTVYTTSLATINSTISNHATIHTLVSTNINSSVHISIGTRK